jgi:tetratricopeptide (TPR) repeat protein
MDKAMESYKKEIQFHPDYTYPYMPLAQALMAKGSINEAIVTLQSFLDVSPGHKEGTTLLCGLLFLGKRYAEAIGPAKTALVSSPEDDILRVALN